MKFDFVIGNPPYQDESNGEKRNYAPPVYNLFLDEAYKVADVVEMIHPARFLFNAGSTPKDWNEKMLSDSHLKVPFYEQDSDKVFPGISTPIKGGIAITYRDSNKEYGAIQAFTQYEEMNSIVHKVTTRKDFVSLYDIVYSRTSYRLTDEMHKEYPEAVKIQSKGHLYDMSSNIFKLLPEIFYDEVPDDVIERILHVMDKVFEEYSSKDSWSLSRLTHGELSWKKSRVGIADGVNGDNPMSLEDIREDAKRVRQRRVMLSQFGLI